MNTFKKILLSSAMAISLAAMSFYRVGLWQIRPMKTLKRLSTIPSPK